MGLRAKSAFFLRLSRLHTDEFALLALGVVAFLPFLDGLLLAGGTGVVNIDSVVF